VISIVNDYMNILGSQDTNAVYMVLTAKEVTITTTDVGSFCNATVTTKNVGWCGIHSWMAENNSLGSCNVVTSYVPSAFCPSSFTSYPNNNYYACTGCTYALPVSVFVPTGCVVTSCTVSCTPCAPNPVGLKFAVIGNPVQQCSYYSSGSGTNCGPQYCGSPNELITDTMISVIMHELAEAITDPTSEGWLDSAQNEIADKCDSDFGSYGTELFFNGSAYYNFVGRSGTKYLTQFLYKNGFGCGQS